MKVFWSLVLACSLSVQSACSSGGGGGGSTAGSVLDPDVAPVTAGQWYRPSVFVTWQWQLQGALNTSYAVDLYDVDLFDTPVATIQAIQSSGKRVICYFSAGSYEDFREDKDDFDPAVLGNTLDGWQDERWLDVRSANVHSIMQARLVLAKNKGCDGVEPDNMDAYANDSGFALTARDQLAFNRFLANEAHARGLSVALKNDLDQIPELVDYYDFAVNEQCFEYSECDALVLFIDRARPVLNAEYLAIYRTDESARSAVCTESLGHQFSTLLLPLALDDSFRHSCL